MSSKKIKKFNKLLDKYFLQREYVKIYRKPKSGEANIYGVIIGLSDNFLQIAENEEFRFNGEVIIKRNQFDAIRCNQFEKTIKKILRTERILTKVKPKRENLKLENWVSIFEGLMDRDIHVIIECENLKKSTFTIGPITKITDKSVEILNYDATGKYNKKASKIKYKNITLLKFNDEYSTMFRKYVRSQKEEKKNAS